MQQIISPKSHNMALKNYNLFVKKFTIVPEAQKTLTQSKAFVRQLTRQVSR
jgi:hypothetical protein